MDKIKRPIILSDKIVERYIVAEHEWTAMRSYINQEIRKAGLCEMRESDEINMRYNLSSGYKPLSLAWYLLEQYFAGNITIKQTPTDTDAINAAMDQVRKSGFTPRENQQP